MSSAYIVLVVNKIEIELCEAHAGRMAAFTKAISIAKEKYPTRPEWINENPKEESLDIGCKWDFVNTSNTMISVYFQPIQNPQIVITPPQTVFLDSCGSVQMTPPPVVKPMKDDPANDSLPGGWSAVDNKPITMEFVKNNPYKVKDYQSLSHAQQKALVVARIRKRPNFSILLNGYGTFIRDSALREFDNNTDISDILISKEIGWLEEFLESVF